MTIGVLSDTHGNTVMMLAAAAELTQSHHAEIIFHLGDDYADATLLDRAGYNVRKVPGLWCPEYRDTRVEKVLVESFEGVTIAAAHADKDLRAQHRSADVILTGHTHSPAAVVLGKSLYVNPGHLKALISRDEPASYAVLEISPKTVKAVIHKFSGGDVLASATLQRSA
jgi:putative phosphoesterase